ncbi:cytochrome P450 [Aspergillus sclerotiicarbonarius CBS 121057]|uniref:Cytochrome P450 n=1 Tax=Aspergillus sclerotiicarbonarius (strain CBS 121057 / IBT 28362) TaxID=1448318 RepID=A0A319EGM9_ASPSB|nr:cytochrome P450 [Aspergillus sclerotiicarbonarius CBS 121057]
MLTPEILAILTGVLAHLLIFIHGEWHLQGAKVVTVHLVLFACVYAFDAPSSKYSNPTTLISLYLSALFSSISIYRLFFHRLRAFPGPRLAALSKLWHVWKCRDSRGHHVLETWHQQYGPFVRTGPSEITIFHPAAHEAMDGRLNRNTRSDCEDFGMLRNQRWHTLIFMFRSAMALLGPFSPAIWIPRLAFDLIPGLWRVRSWFKMLEFCDWCMARRIERKLEDRDIASWFIEDHRSNPQENWLSGDTATLIVAGSDTTAPALTHLFYFLARYPQHAEKIREEIVSVDAQDQVALSKLPHLNGTINESMRLLPAILTQSSRVTPPEGLTIEGTFIPGNIKLCAPRYSIGRLESAYAQPHDFIPERWYSRPDLIRDPRAFAPFGLGMYPCLHR